MADPSTDPHAGAPETAAPDVSGLTKAQLRRMRRFDKPWLNPKLIWGVGLLLGIVLLGILGRIFWDTDLVFTGSGMPRQGPVGVENIRGQVGTWAHPLGTDVSGKDILALLIVGAPNSLFVGMLASIVGMSVGICLGFTAGFVGGRTDDVIRVGSDVMITIPPLLILVVFQAAYGDITLTMMAMLIAAFVWQSPTRLIRAQVLSMRESGYVQMARLSGASTAHIMFREMLPNLVPYLFGSFIANVTTSIVTAVGLEVLGLGPQRVPTLGRVIYDAINSGALIQNLWWWWGIPTVLLAVMFVGLLLINLGLDEVSNPRLRRL